MKDRHDLMTMTGEQFKNATVEERIDALDYRISSYKFHREWCEKYSYMDKRNWEYRQHKKFAQDSRSKIEEWLTAIDLEVIPETANY